MYAAYATLPAEIKALIDDKKALNMFLYGAGSQENYKVDFENKLKYVHPMVRTHPETGRDALYVNRLMSWRIEGMEEEASRRLLDMLFDHIEQPQFGYTHKWRPGDLLLWDNRCTQHARNDFSAAERRLLRRVVVKGDKPFRRSARPFEAAIEAGAGRTRARARS
jgi:taurine dioxygenase